MNNKKFLILVKKSMYKFFFLERRSQKTQKELKLNASIRANFKEAHDAHYKTVQEIERVLRKYKVCYVRRYRGRKVNYDQFDFVITVGGDGTFLEAARNITRQIILGVNSDPKHSIGRFCVANRKNFAELFAHIVHGNVKVKSYQRLNLKLNTNLPVKVLNDMLICHANPAAMSRYILSIGKQREDHRSSGLWVSTPVGSSGAIYSAGGRVVDSLSHQFQYGPRELFRKNEIRYQLTGGLIDFTKPVVIRSMMRHGVIFIDGAHVRLPFGFGCIAKITISKTPLKTIDYIDQKKP